MATIFEMARALGEELQKTPQVEALVAAKAAYESDPEIAKLVEEYTKLHYDFEAKMNAGGISIEEQRAFNEQMKAKGEAIFPLTQEQINQIAAIGAKEGVRAYKEEQKKEERRRKKEDSKVRKTKKLLSSYRRIKATLSDGEQFTPEEQAELRWKFIEDLMGNTREIAGKSERTIKDTERKREEDLYCVFRIEKATEMYREECEKSGSEEAKRRYRELSMMYLDEKPYTVQEISEVENISDKTVYKDIGIACGIVAIYLLGADL